MDAYPARITLRLHSRLPLLAAHSATAAAATAAAASPVAAVAAAVGQAAPVSAAVGATPSSSAAEAAMQALASCNPCVNPMLALLRTGSGLPLSPHARQGRGVLLPLPPTLTAARQAALDEARRDPYWKQMIVAAKLKRRRERAEAKRMQRKRARREAQQQQTTATSGQAERKQADEENTNGDDNEEDEPDSEDEGKRAHFARAVQWILFDLFFLLASCAELS
jgi:hypothetical protein